MNKGTTQILKDGTPEYFLDCTLKIIGEVQGAQGSECLFVCVCEAERPRVKSSLKKRILLPVSAFDGKPKFIQSLRDAFGSGSFILNGTPKDVSEFGRFLKTAYYDGPEKIFKVINHIGHQSNGYWVLTDEVHLKGSRLVPEEEQDYVLEGKKSKNLCLRNYFIDVASHLVKSPSEHQEAMKNFLSLPRSFFEENEDSFLAAVAFVLWRLVSSEDNEQENCDAANIGLVYSPARSIGKTTTLKLIAYGQGIIGKKNPLFMSLGDQQNSGTSTKLMLEELSKTSLVVLLDDGHFSGRLNEFLLQVQGGLSQGSLTQGKLFPHGSVLLASNQVEGERLSGRVIRFPFQTSGSGFCKEKEKLLEDFMAFMKNNKGLLTLWAVRHVKLFKDCTEKDVDKDIGELLTVVLRGTVDVVSQARWVKALAKIILTQALLFITSGIQCDLVSIFRNYVNLQCNLLSVLKKLQRCIYDQIKEDHCKGSNVLSWLNPCVQVNKGGKKMVPAIGLKNSKIKLWPDVDPQDVKEYLKGLGKSTTELAIQFAAEDTCTVKDLKKRAKNSKAQKGGKIPRQLLSESLGKLIELVTETQGEDSSSELEILLGPTSPIPQEIEACAGSLQEIDEDVITRLKNAEETLKTTVEEYNDQPDNVQSHEEGQSGDELCDEELTSSQSSESHDEVSQRSTDLDESDHINQLEDSEDDGDELPCKKRKRSWRPN
ncbi:uncharacterized protein LOC111347488 isoform X2 [Stylophora pistillata]|nr:uncharacterized protein LOC111347488 isoform X2 [Stylophora pistillata]